MLEWLSLALSCRNYSLKGWPGSWRRKGRSWPASWSDASLGPRPEAWAASGAHSSLIPPSPMFLFVRLIPVKPVVFFFFISLPTCLWDQSRLPDVEVQLHLYKMFKRCWGWLYRSLLWGSDLLGSWNSISQVLPCQECRWSWFPHSQREAGPQPKALASGDTISCSTSLVLSLEMFF